MPADGPRIIGLTGSIAMGKSAVAAMFDDAGIPVFDADAAVRAMQAPGGALLNAIERAFPGSTGPEGVDRRALGELVFADADALARLEAIMHPAVAEKRQAFLRAHAREPLVLFDIPLLFEKGGNTQVDHVVVVSAPEDIQRERVLQRPGMTAEKFSHILSLQMPDAEKRARADYIIDTGTALDATRRQVEALITKLQTLPRKKR
ncbi:dephospho-CoA kinase [Pontixanthobacter sp.]|uniref:dephospho-CoA kinase n=1 Tax=Pontixanthobacter sp. TaxID=2792078 RepID=UPI003C7D3C87